MTPSAFPLRLPRISLTRSSRTVRGSGGVGFARQLAERNAGDQPVKKFRSSAAPKGSKLAAGYRDRTQDRIDDSADDKAKRIKALEESMKLGQISTETFEQLRDEITGGDLSATHLVKGLDRKLLDRVRRGENVMADGAKSTLSNSEPEPDLDEELEKLESTEVAPVARERTVKKGEMAPPPPMAGAKRSRDAILAELKAQRRAAAEAKLAAQPQLSARFRKIGQKRESRIEVDARGREVLITYDEDGHEKRKVRKVRVDSEADVDAGLPMPAKDTIPLGMEIPENTKVPPSAEDDEDDDIFENAGVDYNPLVGSEEDDDSDSDSDADEEVTNKRAKDEDLETSASLHEDSSISKPNNSINPPTAKPRNYFNEADSVPSEIFVPRANPLKDPAILAALAKARQSEPVPETTEEEARLRRKAQMLQTDRDMDDLDMGFGSSRVDDEADGEDVRVKLAEWKGTGADEDDDGEVGKGKKEKRKRGRKKRKGDKNSAADVLSVIAGRKKAAD